MDEWFHRKKEKGKESASIFRVHTALNMGITASSR